MNSLEDRKFRLLQQLQQRNEIPLAELAEKCNVTTRTIRNDLKTLPEALEDTGFVEIEQGICHLYITNPYGFAEKMELWAKTQKEFDSPKKRMAYILKTLMTSQKPYPIEELAYEMNLGRTTLNGEIKRLNTLLKGYGLSIQGMQSAGIVWRGEELQLRFFILEHMYDLIYDEDVLQKSIAEAILPFLSQYGLEHTTEESFFRHIVLAIDRTDYQHTLPTMEEKFHRLKEGISWEITCTVAEQLQNTLGITLPETEKLFLTIPLAGMRTPTDLDAIAQVKVDETIETVIEKMIQKIDYALNLSLKREHLQQDFVYHISFMVNRLRFGYLLKNPIAEEIRNKYPLAYKMAKIAACVIEKEYAVTVPEDELGYLTAYFGAYLLEYSINQPKPYRIALVCSTGRGTARLIASQLKRLLDHNTEINLYSEKQTTAEDLDSHDIVFSTVKLPFVTKKPVIPIKDIFDEKELLTYIQNVNFLEKIEGPTTETASVSLLATLLKEDRFFLLDETKNYLENTKQMVQYLTTQNDVDAAFWQRIQKREAESTMVFGNSIAFPHTINKQKEGKLVLALGVSAKPLVSETGEKIQLIFLLALPEDKELDDSVLVRLYDEMIFIAQTEGVAAEIAKAETYQQMVRCFMKLGVGTK